MRIYVFFIATLLLQSTAFADSDSKPFSSDGLWQQVFSPRSELPDPGPFSQVEWAQLERAQWPVDPLVNQPVFRLEQQAMDTSLQLLPLAGDAGSLVTLPMPDGGYADFLFTRSSLMSPELAARYPEIQTFSLVAVDRPGVFVINGVRFNFQLMGSG